MQFQPDSVPTLPGDRTDSAHHEVVTGSLEIGISIKNLTKIYGHVGIRTLVASIL